MDTTGIIGTILGLYMDIVEKKMDTTGIIGIILGLYRDNGKENGNRSWKRKWKLLQERV